MDSENLKKFSMWESNRPSREYPDWDWKTQSKLHASEAGFEPGFTELKVQEETTKPTSDEVFDEECNVSQQLTLVMYQRS